MFPKCPQNVYHISINLCTHFVCKIKRTKAAKICIENVYKSLSKYSILYINSGGNRKLREAVIMGTFL